MLPLIFRSYLWLAHMQVYPSCASFGNLLLLL